MFTQSSSFSCCFSASCVAIKAFFFQLKSKPDDDDMTAMMSRLVKVRLEPHDGIRSTTPFFMEPDQVVVPGKLFCYVLNSGSHLVG